MLPVSVPVRHRLRGVAFNSFPVASRVHPDVRRHDAGLSILSQLLLGSREGGIHRTSPRSFFQFFPSCFPITLFISGLGRGAVDFQFFPSCFQLADKTVLPTPFPPFNSFPVASVYRHPEHRWLLRPPFQFFPSCFEIAAETLQKEKRLNTFNSFPVASVQQHALPLCELQLTVPFNSFPVASRA